MTSFRTCIEVSRPKSFFAEDAISHACHVRQLAASFPFVAQAGAGSSSRPSSKASSGSGLGSISGAALSEAQFSDDVELARPVSALLPAATSPSRGLPGLAVVANWAALHLPSRDSLTQFSDLTGIVVTGVLIDNGDRSGDRKPSRGARNRRRPGCSSHDPVAKAYPTVG